jgi:hypothetical protein
VSTTVRPALEPSTGAGAPSANGSGDRGRGGMARVGALLTSPGAVSWAAARVAVVGALALARFLVSNLQAEDPTGRPPSGLIGWDASWYLRIIESGYRHLPWESLRFFPLLPLLAKVVSPVTGARVALLLVVNAAALGAGLLIERLTFHETGDRAAAGRAAWFLALLPPAFVLVMGYAESLLIVFGLATFLALRRRQWTWAVAAGLLAGLTRPLGVLLVVPATIEALRGFRGEATSVRERATRLLAAGAPGAGGVAYLVWSWMAYGDPLRPLRLQQAFDRRGGFVNPVRRLIEAAQQLAGGADLGSGLHFPWAVGFLVLLAVCFWKLPASYGWFAAAVLLLSLGAGNLDSLERYGLSAFPLVIGLALLVRWPWLERMALVVATTGLVTYATLAFLGAYVP